MAVRKPEQVYQTDLPDAAVGFDVEQFDNAVRNHGVTFVHWRAMRCPVGLIDENDSRRPHDDHSGCSNGFLYTRAGEVTCLFTGNSTGVTLNEIGKLEGSTVQITLPRFYDDTGKPLYIKPYDRLFLAEENIVVSDWQTFRTTGVKDKLRYRVATVLDLVDSQDRRYYLGDFSIQDGQLVWDGTKMPGLDPVSGKGLICSATFTYRPYWYVKNLIHEVRVAQAADPVSGAREVHRMPQAAVIQREYVFEKNEADELAPDKDRQPVPPNGSRFGPR